MSDFTYEQLKENLERLKMKNTLEILHNYLEQAIKDKVNKSQVFFDSISKKEASEATSFHGLIVTQLFQHDFFRTDPDVIHLYDRFHLIFCF